MKQGEEEDECGIHEDDWGGHGALRDRLQPDMRNLIAS
jgi:hypothetical protein